MNDDPEKEASASSKTFKTRAWSDKTSTRPLETKVKTSHKASARSAEGPPLARGVQGQHPCLPRHLRQHKNPAKQHRVRMIQGFRLNIFSDFRNKAVVSLLALTFAGIRGRNTRRRQQPPKYGHTVKVEVADLSTLGE